MFPAISKPFPKENAKQKKTDNYSNSLLCVNNAFIKQTKSEIKMQVISIYCSAFVSFTSGYVRLHPLVVYKKN